MCVFIKSRPEFKMGHIGSKTRSLGQFLEKTCGLGRRYSFDPVFMKLCQNEIFVIAKYASLLSVYLLQIFSEASLETLAV